MLTAVSRVLTLPTNSSISLGLFPAASIRTGFSIKVGMAYNQTADKGSKSYDPVDAKEPAARRQVGQGSRTGSHAQVEKSCWESWRCRRFASCSSSGDDNTLREALNRWLPADLAELVDALPRPDRVQVLRLIQPKRAAETFAYLDLDTQQTVLTTFSAEESRFVLNEMAPDDRTALLAELPPEQAERFIDLLDPAERQVARALLEYREDSVGRLMTPDYLVVRREWTIRHVLDHIRAHGRDRETLNVIYITDEHNKLVDDLRIREILLAPLHAHVSDLMDNQFVSLCVTDGAKRPSRSSASTTGRRCRSSIPRAGWPGSSRSTTCSTLPSKKRPATFSDSAAWKHSTIPT